jgi:hypothetical protein
MTVQCPFPEWPSALLEAGPPEDRSILLRGHVMIGPGRFMLTAVRVDPIRLGPDYRPDQALSIYGNHELSGLLDMVSELIGFAAPTTLQLGSGRYVLWMLPSSEER